MKKFAFLISFLTCLLLSSCNSLNDEVVIVPNPDEPTNPDTPVEEDLYEEMYDPTSNLQITLNFTNEAIYKLAKYSLDEVKKEMYHPCDVTISLNDELLVKMVILMLQYILNYHLKKLLMILKIMIIIFVHGKMTL